MVSMKVEPSPRAGPRALGRRAGRAAPAALVLTALACALGLGLAFGWRWMSRAEPASALRAPEASAVAAEARPSEPAVARAEPSADAARETAAVPSGPERPLRDPARFAGRGSIRGRIELPEGALPAVWSARLAPSRALIGGERAEPRVLELAAGETEFAFEDLPLAGYELSVRVPGLHALARHVLLVRGQEHLDLAIELSLPSAVSGRVVDAAGFPQHGLGLVLERAADRSRSTALSDAAGFFRFEDVAPGEVRLFAGAPERPLAGPLDLDVRAAEEHVPELVVPVLGAIDVLVRDADGRAVAGAAVRGYGDAGGVLEAETDSSGRARARFLPGGTYKLFASLPEVGTGWTRVTLETGREASAQIRIGRR